MDDPAVENIDVHGCDPVWLSTPTHGAAPVADSCGAGEMVAAFAAYLTVYNSTAYLSIFLYTHYIYFPPVSAVTLIALRR